MQKQYFFLKDSRFLNYRGAVTTNSRRRLTWAPRPLLRVQSSAAFRGAAVIQNTGFQPAAHWSQIKQKVFERWLVTGKPSSNNRSVGAGSWAEAGGTVTGAACGVPRELHGPDTLLATAVTAAWPWGCRSGTLPDPLAIKCKFLKASLLANC